MKIFFLMLLVLFGVCFFSSNNETEIRVRVLSNSDSVNDLKYKEEVVKYLKDVIFKLNGEAELFMRPQAIKKEVTHAVGEKLINKTILKSILITVS